MVCQEKSIFTLKDEEIVEEGVALLNFFGQDPGEKKEALDLIEILTERPDLQLKILEKAEKESGVGLVEAEVKSERKVDGNCIRCGRSIKKGFFIDTGSGQIGPFGSTCIQRVKN